MDNFKIDRLLDDIEEIKLHTEIIIKLQNRIKETIQIINLEQKNINNENAC